MQYLPTVRFNFDVGVEEGAMAPPRHGCSYFLGTTL